MRCNKILRLILCVLLTVSILAPVSVYAYSPKRKVVRVGWYESTFCFRDRYGRRCGLDYEYQQKLSAYTGWTYEYVEDSWSNLLEKLKQGEIDLLSDVSYTKERTASMSFPDLPMGSESYYIYIDADNKEITPDDWKSFNGKRIGVNKGSVQEEYLKTWAQKHNIALTVLPLTAEETESMAMLARGEIDGYTSTNTFGAKEKVIPVCKVGASDFFYAVNKNRPDLLDDLNRALSGIQDEDPFYNQRMFEEHLFLTKTNAFLTPAQEKWLAEHGKIRVGYRENYLPFSAKEAATDKLTGALKDYLAHSVNSLKHSNISFEAMPFATTEAAMLAMKTGRIDCLFPANLSAHDANVADVILTNPVMRTEMQAIMRATDTRDISPKSTLTIAVNSGNANIETFIKDHYPLCNLAYYSTLKECCEALVSGKADCFLVSNYRINAMQEVMEKYKLYSVPTGESMPLAFAVNKDARELYFILNKTTVLTKRGDMDSALASYAHVNQKVSFTQLLRNNWITVIAVIVAAAALTIFLLLQKLKTEQKMMEQQRQIEEALRRELQQKEQLQTAIRKVNTDPLTGVKSKHAYLEATKRMDQRIADGSVAEFGVVVCDLNDLKAINDHMGHESGDKAIREACRAICVCFAHSPVYRIGGDEFAVILEGADYTNRDALLESLENQMAENVQQGKTAIAFGCSLFNPLQDKTVKDVFDRADDIMYHRKAMMKHL